MTETKRPQLHQSGLELLSKCGEAFYRRYILKERRPSQSYVHVGRGVDKAANDNLQSKIDTAALLPIEAVTETARDATRASIDESGIVLTADEAGMTEKAAADMAVDKAVRLSKCHATLVAPVLKPARVQAGFSMEIPGFPFDIVGTRDLDEIDGTVRDLKSSKKSPSKSAADDSDQLTMYAMSVHVVEAAPPPIRVALDYVVDLKGGTKAHPPLISTRDRSDFQVLLNRIENAAKVIEKGAFVPARQGGDWWCSTTYCEFATTCRYFRQPKSLVIEEGD